MSASPRVLMIIKDAENYKGSGVQMWHLVAALRACGVEVSVVSHGKEAGRDLGSDTNFHRLSGKNSREFGGALRKFLRARGSEFDIWHVHGHGALSTLASREAKKQHKPLVVKVTAAGPNSRLDSWEKSVRRLPFLKWWIARHANRWIAISSETTRGLRAIGVPVQKISEIPNGVSPIFTSLAPEVKKIERAHLGVGEDEVVLVSVGSLSGRKRPALALEAFALAAADAPGLRLWMIGSGPERRALESLAVERGVSEKVRFWGNIEREELARILPLGDVFILTSKLEGLSNALLEAMRCGLAPIANFSSGNADLIKNGESGALVEVTELAEVARILVSWFLNPILIQQLGERARSDTARFEIESVARDYQALYHSLLDSPAK